MTGERFVIVGASLAGGAAATNLREEGFDGKVILIGAETHPPYERPPLSKEYLRGQQPFEKALLYPREFYADNSIETVFGVSATSVDPREGLVELDNGGRVRYDKLLVATGGRNRRFPIPGLSLEGVYGLRSVEDADGIRQAASAGGRAAVVGMGFIGSEVAASLRQMGLEVTTIELRKAPLERVLGEEVGAVLEGLHQDHGVRMIFEDSVAAFEGSRRVERVLTAAGRSIPCDFAVVGLGIEPITDLVSGSGIKLENGIVVDEYCRSTVHGIFAAGDVANHYHPVFGRHVRVEHWQNALKQGAAAARSMLDRGRPYEEIHWFWSDQFDVNIQYAGFHTDWDQLVVRGSPKERSFVAFYLKEGVVQAAVAINRGRDLRRSMHLIKQRIPIAVETLQDEDVDLRKLVPAETHETRRPAHGILP